MVGYLGNTFLPARAGEIIRSAYLGKISGTGTSFVFATAMVERLLDVIALVLIGSISVLLQFQISSLLAGAIKIMAIAGAIGLGIVIVMPFQEKLISRLIAQIPLPPKLRQTITEQVARFLVGMRSLHNVRRLGSFIFLTAVIWLIDGLGNMIGVRIISQTSQPWAIIHSAGCPGPVERHPLHAGLYRSPAIRSRECSGTLWLFTSGCAGIYSYCSGDQLFCDQFLGADRSMAGKPIQLRDKQLHN